MADPGRSPLARLARLRHSSLLRFLLVGGIGELLYLGLYALIWRWSGERAVLAIAIAGGLCLLINAVLHARVSFRVAFRGALLLRYLLIQAICLGLSLALGALLQRLALNGLLIGVCSGLVWTLTSFLLTRRAFAGAGLRA